MNQDIIYINGNLVDLYPNTVIAFTYQSGDVADLKTRLVDLSNSISIPKTEANQRTFKNIEVLNSLATLPYRVASVKHIQNGLERLGSGIITDVSDKYKLSIYSNTIDFFKAIDGKNVDDMDFEVYETIDDSYIDSIRLSLGTFSAPVIDFGTLFPSAQTLNNTRFLGLTGWSNEGSGLDWGLNIVGEPQLNVVFNDGTANQTPYLTQDYKFFKNFRYRISLSWDMPVNDASGSLDKFALYIGTGASRQLIKQVTFIFATTGNFYFDEIFTVTSQDYDTVQIYAEALVANPGDELRLVLRSIKITDYEGVIDITAGYYIPLVSYKQIINKIFSDAGFSTSYMMQDSDFFDKLYISFSKSTYSYPQRLIDKMLFNASADGTQHIVSNNTTKQDIEFSLVNSQGSYEWYDGLSQYTIPAIPYNVGVTVKARIIVDIIFSLGTTGVEFFFNVDGVTQTLADSIPFAIADRYVLTFESNFITAGLSIKEFKLSVARAAGVGSVTLDIVEGQFWVEIDKDAFGVINLSALVLPTVTQKSFITDFFMRFAILADEKNGVMTMAEMEKIISNKIDVVDWTNKRDTSKQEAIKFIGKGYAQENVFTDIENPDVVIQGANETLYVDNETLDFKRIYYQSIMSAVEQNNNNGMQLCRVPFFDLTHDDGLGDYPANPRLFYLRDKKDGDSTIKYNGSTKTTYYVAVYNDPSVPKNTTWKYFIGKYYPSLQESINKAKFVTRYYFLDDMDISNLNKFKLVYDNNQFFLINKLSNYVSGKVTKAELFKVF